MKKGLSLILLIIATQSYAAITWNCTSSDIKQSYLPKECTGVGSNSGSNTTSTTPTTTKIVDMSGCLGSDKEASQACVTNIASLFATNGRTIVSATAVCPPPSNQCTPSIFMKNVDGTTIGLFANLNNYVDFSNYSEVPAGATICNGGSNAPLSKCPSGTYAMTFNPTNGNPDKLVLVP